MKTRFYQILAVSALCLAAAALAVALWTSARAQEEAPQAALAIPTTLNYQGHLRDPDGSLTTGAYDITAKIYNVATGGSPLYTTTLPDVTVRDGLFNIVLGDNPALPSSVFASSPLYIGISLDGGAELIPRQRLHAVPWAFQASTLINNAVAQTVQGLTSNGNVTVNGSAAVSGDTALNGNASVSGDTALNGNATVSGNVVITGTLAHPGETFVGPHLISPVTVVSKDPCNADLTWVFFDVSADIPSDATAVILQIQALQLAGHSGTIKVRSDPDADPYLLLYGYAGSSNVGWGGQGVYPIKNHSFEYKVESEFTGFCTITLIGYFK